MKSEYKKIMPTLKLLSWIGLVVFFIFITMTAMNRADSQRCDRIRVVFQKDKNLGFIHSSDIQKEVNRANPLWKGKQPRDIKANMIEHHIRENDYVKDAEVYVDHNQNLNVYIVPKLPIARIHNGYESYYLSEMWDRMPVSMRYTSRVIQVSGHVAHLTNPTSAMDSLVENELKVFLNYLDQNPEWKAVIDQIYITPRGKFELYLAFSDVTIRMGYIQNGFEKRMEKMKNFFKSMPYYKDLSQYTTLDFQYSQQVIATRKSI